MAAYFKYTSGTFFRDTAGVAWSHRWDPTSYFTDFKDEVTSEKVFLAEIQVAEKVTGWTQYPASSAYYKSYLNETITLADENSSTETVRKEVVAVEEDGTALTEKSSVANVVANAGSFYHDTDAGTLYVHTSGSDTPDDHTIIAYFWLYFGTKGIELNGKFYEPYIHERGIPTLKQRNANIHWGISEISSGNLVLINNRGYFDQISRKFIWRNKKVKLLLGGNDLAYGEYETLFTGIIVDKVFTRREVTLRLKSTAFRLLESIPTTFFDTTTYPNMDPNKAGWAMPIYYGNYDSRISPIVTCVDNPGVNQYIFRVAVHSLKSISGASISYSGSSTFNTIAMDSYSESDATVQLTAAGYVNGYSKVRVAFEGKADASGNLIESGVSIVEDLLTSYCGYSSADIDATSSTCSAAIAEFNLNVPIEAEVQALAVIERVCVSELAYFDEDGDGQLRYRVWEPTITPSAPKVDDIDFLEPTPVIQDDSEWLFYKVRIGHSYRCWSGGWIYDDYYNADSQYKYGIDDELTVNTYLRSSNDGDTLARRMTILTRDPSPILTGRFKTPIINRLLGDKLQITLDRAPYETAGGYDDRVFEIFGSELSFFPLEHKIQARDLVDYGKGQGFWMATGSPTYGACTQQQRDNSGFWCDTSGYAETADKDSLDKSRWW